MGSAAAVAGLYAGVFRGRPEQVGLARAAVARYLAGHSVAQATAGDAILIVSEFAANAANHSASRGEFFTVRCELHRSYLWVEVEDLGGPWHLRPRDADESWHGLRLVEMLAGPDGWGAEVTSGGGRVVWARLDIAGELAAHA